MRFLEFQQQLTSRPLTDVPAAVVAALDSLPIPVPQGEIAVAIGSRGIANLAAVVRTAGEWLRSRGARPFVVPAMGSHNGATAEGQQRMLEGLGLGQEHTGLEIRSSMDTVRLGEVRTGEVVIDRLAAQSAGVLLVNRVKLHTSFDGPLQSGLVKMAAVGLGKVPGATTFHRAATLDKPAMLVEMGKVVTASGHIWAGLAMLEDGLDATAEIAAMPGNRLLLDEPPLLARYRDLYFPRLPLDELAVLLVATIGKNYSGTGMDTNVIGRRRLSDAPDLPTPKIFGIGCLRLSSQSQGNAIGIGLADAITTALRDAIDLPKTMINAETTGELGRVAMPPVFANDRILAEHLRERCGSRRWIVVPNTLHLSRFWASDDLRGELASRGVRPTNGEPLSLDETMAESLG